MAVQNKNREAILAKLGIAELNDMQKEADKAISENQEVVLLSPTGTGKTLAFLLPVINLLDAALDQVQVLILVPSRELAIQIEQVVREMGSGFKTNAVYGGRSGSKDKIELKHAPAILIGTPGRVADHIRRENITIDFIKTLVLDEFDKSLEVGFEKEMREIVQSLHHLERKILTSATSRVAIPDFVKIRQEVRLDFLSEGKPALTVKVATASQSSKLEGLVQLIHSLGDGSGIVFCNFKDTIQQVSDTLSKNNIGHACFFGGMEQIDRERALIKFRNGTHRLLIATDLAARGIDVPEMDFIIHFQLPPKKEEFTHRNGRTARMHSDGTAYILKGQNERLPDFARDAIPHKLTLDKISSDSSWETLYISGGRKDKISKGDIAGLFFKQGGLQKDELGMIELKQDCAFVAVPQAKSHTLIDQLSNSKLKNKKVRISLLE